MFALAIMYLRRSERTYDPLSDKVVAQATGGRARECPPSGPLADPTTQPPEVTTP